MLYSRKCYAQRPMIVADDYYPVLVTLQPCSVSISQREDLPPPGKTHLDLI